MEGPGTSASFIFFMFSLHHDPLGVSSTVPTQDKLPLRAVVTDGSGCAMLYQPLCLLDQGGLLRSHSFQQLMGVFGLLQQILLRHILDTARISMRGPRGDGAGGSNGERSPVVV